MAKEKQKKKKRQLGTRSHWRKNLYKIRTENQQGRAALLSCCTDKYLGAFAYQYRNQG